MKKIYKNRWWLVRHAPLYNPDGRIYGSTDILPDTSDKISFLNLASNLPKKAIWITSNLIRTIMTAHQLQEIMKESRNIRQEENFNEQNFGEWEIKKWQEISKKEDSYFWKNFIYQKPPKGERFIDVFHRVKSIFLYLNRIFSNENIIAVIHFGTILSILSFIMKINPELIFPFSINNLSITQIDGIILDNQKYEWCINTVNRVHILN